MELKVRIPYELDGKSEIVMLVHVEELANDNGRYWMVRLFGNEGIKSLNDWLCGEYYDDSVMEFTTYYNLMEFITNLKDDIERAWGNYNEEKKPARTTFEKIKRLFQPVMWKEEE